MRTAKGLVWAVAVLGWAWSAAGQGLPAAADHTPADAEAVLLVPSLRGLSAQVASLEAAAGLDAGELQDVLGIFKRELGLARGLDDGGSMMVALTGVGAALEAGRSPNAYLVLPVADYDALLDALGGQPGPQTAVTLPDGFTGVMKQAGSHAVITSDARALADYRPGGQAAPLLADAGPTAARLINESGFAIVLDTDATRAHAAERATGMLVDVLDGIDPLFAFELDAEGWRPMLGALNQTLVQGADTAVLALAMGDDGVTLREAYTPKPDTELSAMLPGEPNGQGTDAALAALISQPVIAAFAADTGAVDVAQLADRLGGLIGLDPTAALGETRGHLAEAMEGVDHIAAAYYTLPQQSDRLLTHWFNTAVVLTGEDLAALAGQARAFITRLNGAKLPLADGGSVSVVALYQPKVRTLGGHTIDTFTVRMSIPQEAQTTPMTQALAALAGVGFTGHLVATQTHVLITTTDDDPATQALLAGLDQPAGLGTTGAIARAREDHLPQRRAMQAYLDLRGITQSLNPVLQMIGGDQAIPTEADLPPIALAVDVQAREVIATAHVPAGVLRLLHEQDFSLSATAGDTP